MVALASPPKKLSLEHSETLFLDLYKSAFPAIARFVKSRNGTMQDAKDIFQDALVVLYERCTEGRPEIDSSYEAYLMGIAKHLWARKFNDEVTRSSMTASELLIQLPDDFYHEVNTGKLFTFLERAGGKCMEILTEFYYHRLSMEKVMRKFGFSSERSATVQKYKCLEKIRDVVKSKSLNYEDFLE